MPTVRRIKIFVLIIFSAGGLALLLTGNLFNQSSHARSSGPDPGFTGAPGEFNCRECHLEDGAPAGSITVNAPQTYVPGQTYQITVNVSNSHPTRQRWGFQLTAVDDTGNRAGTLQPGGDALTQVVNGTLGSPARQYVEHTTAGTFPGQTGGANWTFNWTAPTESVGPVLLYMAGNQANNDGNTSGDSINFTFAAIQPAEQTPDFVVNVSPSSQVVLPGATGTYTVTITPSNGFTGTVNLSLEGLPFNSFASFNPPSVQITDANAKTATLSITNATDAPLGNFTLIVSGTSAGLTRTANASLVTGPTMQASNLSVRAFAAGFEQPTGMAFIGTNDLLVIEKATGKVKRVRNGAVEANVLDLAVNSASERGLLGIALHPNFNANNFVYLFWTESATGADTSDLASVPQLGNRIDRYVWNGSTLIFDRNILRLRAFQEDENQPLRGNHNGGRLAFGPDGKLYVLIGDVGRRGFLQNITTGVGPNGKDDQFGGPEPDDAHLTGVVLRLNDDGATPNDNPFFNATTTLTGEAAVNVKRLFAYGIRNSFGMAFDPVGGKLWTQENGDDAFDEINRVEAGFNGGWIQFMGPASRINEYKSIEVSRGNSLQQLRWPPSLIADTTAAGLSRLYALPGSTYTDPQFSWKYAVAPSPIGFAGQGLGAEYANDLFVGASRTTLLGGYLFRFKLSQNRLEISTTDSRLADKVADNNDRFDLTESESLVVGRDFGITTDILTGPTGKLYVLSLSNGTIYEVSTVSLVQLAAASHTVAENAGAVALTINRTGDASAPVAVEYATSNGTASGRSDYTTARGTLHFAPGETTKTLNILLTDDAFVEGSETFNLTLMNPTGGLVLGSQTSAIITITDNDTAPPASNPIDNAQFFVRQHYHDFLNREPDAPGLAFWTNQITECETRPEAERQGCREVRRINVSAAFFLSIEFQETGYFVYRLHRASFGSAPQFESFIAETRAIGEGVIVGQANWEEQLETNTEEFVERWVQRADFLADFPMTLSATQYVQKLFSRAGVSPSSAELQAAINQYGTGDIEGRARALRSVASSQTLQAVEFNRAFVLMQYFGYLRRDADQSGYNFWLGKLNQFNGNYVAAEMVKAFITSGEYRGRFGP